MSLKSDNVEFEQYCGGQFENGDRYKFFDVWNQFRTLKSNNEMADKTRHQKWAVKIQHCPISTKFDMVVDNDVPN
jgi:hypothetical protein